MSAPLTAEFKYALITTDFTRRDWCIRFRGDNLDTLKSERYYSATAAKVVSASGEVVCQRANDGWEYLLERPF